jgi:hypothetical protein
MGITPASLWFCTAAFGEKYSRMAVLLAQDLARFAPGYTLVVYTDRPALFAQSANVQPVQHRCRGVLPYNERRFAIWHALTVAPAVMYLDADVRICAPVPADLTFLPGLTARSCGSLQKHLQDLLDKYPHSPKQRHNRAVIEKMAQRVGLDPYSPDLKFINEFLFVVSAHGGRDREFLKVWGDLAVYADTLGLHQHPTYAMALAAAKCSFPIHHSEMAGLDFFDDRIEKIRISQGQSTPTAKAQYFEQQRQIEQPRSRRWQRLIAAGQKKFRLLRRHLWVRWIFRRCPARLVDYPQLQACEGDDSAT